MTPKSASAPQSPSIKKQASPSSPEQMSHLLGSTSFSSSDSEADETGWTPVKGRKRCAKKAAGDTPEKQSGVSGTGRRLTLTELRKDRPKKVRQIQTI